MSSNYVSNSSNSVSFNHMLHLNKYVCTPVVIKVSSLLINVDLLYKRFGYPANHILKLYLKSCNPFVDVNINSVFVMLVSIAKFIFNISILFVAKPLNHYNLSM